MKCGVVSDSDRQTIREVWCFAWYLNSGGGCGDSFGGGGERIVWIEGCLGGESGLEGGRMEEKSCARVLALRRLDRSTGW